MSSLVDGFNSYKTLEKSGNSEPLFQAPFSLFETRNISICTYHGRLAALFVVIMTLKPNLIGSEKEDRVGTISGIFGNLMQD